MNKYSIEIKSKRIIQLDEKLSVDRANSLTGIAKGTINHYNNWFLYNNKPYYFKKKNNDLFFLNELIGPYLANYFNLPSVTYSFASYNNEFGIVSECFKGQGKKYFDNYDFLNCTTNELSKMLLKSICKDKENYVQLMNSLLSLVVLDFYSCQNDRNQDNFYLENDKGYIKLAPLFDYELSFSNAYITSYNSVNPIFDFKYPNVKNFKTMMTYEIYKYFKEFPSFYLDMKKILDLDLDDIFKRVESDYEIEIPSYIKDMYLNYDKTKKQYVKKII